MISRRAFLGMATATAAAGCGNTADVLGVRRSVTVAVSWSSAELRSFRTVLDGLGIRDYGVQLIPLGDDISTSLGPRAVRRPDIVMLPQPGLVRAHHADLAALPADLFGTPWPYAPIWRDLVQRQHTLYAVPFKVAHKSTVWYRRSVLAGHRLEPPRTWQDWLRVNAALSAAGIPAMSLAAADGWMLTDLFENVLLRLSPNDYRRIAAAEPPRLSAEPLVARTLRMLGDLWSAPGCLAGGVDRSLVQQFPDAVVEVFGHRRAAMVVAPDFAEPIARKLAADPADIGVFTFPAVNPDRDRDGSPDRDPGSGSDGDAGGRARPPYIVLGGDVAVLPAPAGEHAHDLLRRLVAPRATLPWVLQGGFLAPRRDDPPDAYSAELRGLAEDLSRPDARIAFDLSDQLGVLGGGEGLWRVLAEFLTRVGGRGPETVPGAVEIAVGRLREIEG